MQLIFETNVSFMNIDHEIKFEESLAPWMGKTIKMIEYELNNRFKSAGIPITKEQVIILIKLSEFNGITQSELAEKTFRDKSSLTRLIISMEKKDLILRIINSKDKREKNVYLSDKGNDILKESKRIMKSMILDIENDFEKEEKECFIDMIKRIQNNLIAAKKENNTIK